MRQLEVKEEIENVFIGRRSPSSAACVVFGASNAPLEMVLHSMLLLVLSVSNFRSDLYLIQIQKLSNLCTN